MARLAISTASKPASSAHFAAWTCSSIVVAISERAISLAVSVGTRPLGVKRLLSPILVADELNG